MKKKIILFYPQIPMGSEYYWFPLNMLFLSAPLVERGYHPIIIDENVMPDYIDHLNAHAPDSILFGVSAMTGTQIKHGLRASKYIREKFPDLRVVWGGTHATALPEQTVENRNIDIVVQGQGEETLFELAQAIEEGRELNSIKGIFYKGNGQITATGDRGYYDISMLPPLPFNLLDVPRYISLASHAVSYTASYGCQGRCTFCYWYGNHRWQSFPVLRILDDIEGLIRKYDFRQLFFRDSEFFVNRRRVLEICEGIIKRGLRINWRANGRADNLARFDEENLEFMCRSGLDWLFIGLESGSPRILELMQKRITLEQMRRVVRMTKDLPIDIFLSLMFGVPTETIEDLEKTKLFVDELRTMNKNIKIQTPIFVPLPGTPLAELAEENGFVPPQELEGWATIDREVRFYELPWFTREKNMEYLKRFNEWFPSFDVSAFKKK